MREALLEGMNRQQEAIPVDERCLTEVDNLHRLRNPDNSIPESVVEHTYQNLRTAVQEGAMPHAISTTHHEWHDGSYWWLDQTIVDVAKSGYRFHTSEAALQRVDVEVEEAASLERGLRPGIIKVFISPKMTRNDAPLVTAKQEHLADDDMVRIHMADEQGGVIRGKFMQSLLVKDIPLSAWVAMLEDPANLFGTSIPIHDKESALGVMGVHEQLELPADRLPNGVIDLLHAVLPYLDPQSRVRVERQIALFSCDQAELQRQAENIAARWLDFEINLSDSLHVLGFANDTIVQFVHQFAGQWNEQFMDLLKSHTLSDGKILMSRKLASGLERARQNTLWAAGAVISGNEAVLTQLDERTIQTIYETEMSIQKQMNAGTSAAVIQHLETQNNRAIAAKNIAVGGGCAGGNKDTFSNGSGVDGERGPFAGDDGEENFSLPDKIRCIKCSAYSPKEEVVKDESWCCPKCHYEIDICTGETLHESVSSSQERSTRVNIIAEMVRPPKRLFELAA